MGDNDQHGGQEDAPLDFSIKRTSPVPDEGEHRPGVLRSPELGQTAVPPVSNRLIGSMPDKSNTDIITIKPEEKIGEPQPALPGLIPGVTAALPAYPPGGLLPNIAAMQGMLPFIGSVNHKKPQVIPQQQQSPGGGKGSTRPFKAYPKEPLQLPLGYFGLPGMNPFPGVDNNSQMMQAGSEEMFKQYRDYVIKLQEQQREQLQKNSGGVPLDKSPPPMHKDTSSGKLPSSPTNVSSTSSSNGGSLPTSPLGGPPTSLCSPSSSSSVSTTTSAGNKRKRLSILPDEQKDQAYWERRRKNNDAAKRSRDARRAKEDEIAIRAAFLEQENLKLRVEVTSLKNETAKLRCMLYNS